MMGTLVLLGWQKSCLWLTFKRGPLGATESQDMRLLILTVCLLLATTAAGEPKPKGVLGVAIGPSSQDYGTSLEEALADGLGVYEIPQQWKQYRSPANRSVLGQLHSLMKKHRVPVILSLNPLDTMENQIPSELQSRDFDDPLFIKRYNQFVDDTLAALPGLRMVSISVGNEVDILLGTNPRKWKQYTHFFTQAKAHIGKVRPKVPVGVKLTYNAFKDHPKLVRELVSKSDRVMVTYYPVDNDRVRDPKVVKSELAALVRAYPKKKIQLCEVGYPDSKRLGSSQARQAQFVGAVFSTWDKLPQIELVNFVWLNDMTPAATNQLKTVYGKNAPLVHFLASLGLRTHKGQAKLAYARWKKEAKARGFGLR